MTIEIQMRMAQGYVTEDGTFFESKKEATLYEAEFELRHKLSVGWPQIDQEKFFEVVLNVKENLWSYLNAYNATDTDERPATDAEVAEASASNEAKVDEGAGHVEPTEEDIASILKLPTRRHSNVSDVGSGASPEEVPDRRKVDGA